MSRHLGRFMGMARFFKSVRNHEKVLLLNPGFKSELIQEPLVIIILVLGFTAAATW